MAPGAVHQCSAEELGPWMQTFTGKRYSFLKPTPEMIDIVDIAHALAHTCRFGGHVKHFYSVAQHSVNVSLTVEPKFAFEALMHDAHEAYVGDVLKPFKELLDSYAYLSGIASDVVRKAFNLPIVVSDHVRGWDTRWLGHEAWQLMAGDKSDWQNRCEQIAKMRIVPATPFYAEKMFLERFNQLWKGWAL